MYLAFLNTVVGDDDSLQGLGLSFERDVSDESLPFGKGDGLKIFLIADKTHAECIAAFRHLVDEEETVDVGGGTIACAIEDDIGKGNGFACFLIG